MSERSAGTVGIHDDKLVIVTLLKFVTLVERIVYF